MASKEQPTRIDSLDINQLAMLKERIETELQQLNSSMMSLQRVAGAFGQAGQAIEGLKDSSPGQPILLPITQSLYVSGTLTKTDRVLVDVGTGYFIEKDSDEGIDFCKRKVLLMRENLEGLQKTVQEKSHALQQISLVLQNKLGAAQAQDRQK